MLRCVPLTGEPRRKGAAVNDGVEPALRADRSEEAGEVALDIDVAGSVAPGAKIAVYFAPWTEQANDIVRTRHYHHRITDVSAPPALTSLTSRAWQAAQYALSGDEAGARQRFDEIRATMVDLDCLSAPLQAREEELLADSRTACSELQAELFELTRQIDSIRASICWRMTLPIRWLHQQADRARRALAKTHLC